MRNARVKPWSLEFEIQSYLEENSLPGNAFGDTCPRAFVSPGRILLGPSYA